MNYRSILLFLIFTISVGMSCVKAEVLDLRDNGILNIQDTARSEIVYVHIAIDPKKNNEREVKYEMLTFGNRLSHYGGYENYQLDSIYMADPTLHLDHPESYNLYKQYDTIRDSMTMDRSNGTLTYYSGFFLTTTDIPNLFPKSNGNCITRRKRC